MKKSRPWMKTGKNRNCLICDVLFYIPKNQIESGRGKYCSRKCSEQSRVGKKMHPNTRIALSKVIPWNKGLKASEDDRVKRNVESAHAGYKEKKPTPWNKGLRWGKSNWIRLNGTHQYRNLHKRIQRRFGKPEICKFCNADKNLVWANVSGNYLEDRNDWINLCQKCHMNFDKPFQYEKTT